MVAAASVGPGRHPLPITSPRGGSPAAGSGEASLLVVEHGSAEAGDDLGYRAAQLLAPGGLLAVLSQHDREPAGETGQAGAASGVSTLRDPTGSIVASAQNADLLYLQHIVLVPRHPTALHVAANTTRPSRPVGVPESLDATGEHIDLCLFLRPPAPILAAGAA